MTIASKEMYYGREIVIDLTGPAGNAFALLGNARKWCKELDLDWKTIEAELTAGDYEHLVEVLDMYFGDYVTFLR